MDAFQGPPDAGRHEPPSRADPDRSGRWRITPSQLDERSDCASSDTPAKIDEANEPGGDA